MKISFRFSYAQPRFVCEMALVIISFFESRVSLTSYGMQLYHLQVVERIGSPYLFPVDD